MSAYGSESRERRDGSDHAHYRPVRAWSIAIMLALMMMVNFLDKIVFGMISVPMMRDLGLTPSQFGLIGGSLNWLFAIAAVAGGMLADRIATRIILLLMALSWSLLQLPMLFAGSMAVVLAARVLLGAGEGPASPVSLHALYKWFPDEKRGLPAAVLYQGSALGLFVAGLAIPLVTARWGWRANFAVLAVLGFAWCVCWFFFGAEGPLERPHVQRDERRVPWRTLLADRTVVGNFCGHFAANWVLATSLTWMPHYLQAGLGFSATNSGRLFALFVAVTTPMGLGLAWLSQHLLCTGMPSRKARGLFIAITLAAAGVLRFAVYLPALGPLGKMLALTASSGLTLAMYSVGPAMLSEVTPDGQRGGVLALSNAIGSLAGLAAPVLTGLLIQHARGAAATAIGFEQSCALCGFVLIGCGVLCARWLDPQRSRTALHTLHRPKAAFS
ncbi:MFS transporter [Burkholderia multivorans]|uniref:MFS transporter n=1 Tax=Burkholderia multivorans TaxID=87883 RepID=A0AB37AN82_9BURK|nr:MFS transporter [Burkholderia multivorans]MBU9589625.1 MFS transporter [Burkholderia multivorans]PRE39300.1 MFS transporter [Burkholderia multivorans]PRE42279.1 MFS transporter [Burkholderia multivorans]